MIRAGIVGYGNLGKAIAENIKKTPDFDLVKIFTRRNPGALGDVFEKLDNIDRYKEDIDVIFLCVGSATDVPEIAPRLAGKFNVVDAYDNHHDIPRYIEEMEKEALAGKKSVIVATGWDPGLFSLNRLMIDSIFNSHRTFTFWGKGVSQGHSDAIRGVEGVKYGVQYTVPKQDVLDGVKDIKGKISAGESHDRVCYVVADESEHLRIEERIKTMPDYFADYNTEVNFISEDEFLEKHRGLPHGGHVIGIGESAAGNTQQYEFSLALESNPDFTAAVNIACGRAAYKFAAEGRHGAFTMLDIPPVYLSAKTRNDLIKNLL